MVTSADVGFGDQYLETCTNATSAKKRSKSWHNSCWVVVVGFHEISLEFGVQKVTLTVARACDDVCRLVAAAAIIILLFTFADVPSARGDMDAFSIDGEPVRITGSMRMREEVWNWFGPGAVPKGMAGNRYNFLGGYVRLGASYERDGVKGYFELMSPFLVNLPDNAGAPAPQGILGLGGNYFQPNFASNSASVFLKQGYLEFGKQLIEGADFKGGRFEFFDGAEYLPEDGELTWIAKNRISQRLIGNFGFSDIMRSFDGAVARYGNKAWQATVMYGVPTKGVFDLQGMNEISNTDVLYASLNAGPNKFWGTSLGRIFYIYYDDGRKLAPVDNRPPAARAKDKRPIGIHTVGVDYVRTLEIGPGVADFMLWGAGQLGSWGSLSQESYAAVVEGGYKLPRVAWQPWLRLGYTTTSGDGNPKDGTHGTFFQILPTARSYAMFPFFNMMNINDAMAQLILKPFKGTEVQSSLHGLWLSSNKDLWYSGGGEFDNKNFGYAGRGSSNHSYLATLLDSQFSWKIDEHLSTTVYYGHAFGGTVVSSIYPGGKEADYGFVELNLSI